ncbi:MAG: MATE family efflux transporter [Oscillospiraceae bacterium]|nr:MATE family efflux transporter [Oscillospiraceae bacterium]
MKKTKDLTLGKPVVLIFMFALPLFLGNLLQEIYNIADTMIVSYNLGQNDFAAMGATAAIFSLIIGFLNGTANGFSLVTARYFGAKDYSSVKKAIAATLILSLVISAIVTVVSLIYVDDLLRILGTPDEIMGSASRYITIILSGAVITMSYNAMAGIMRALGNSAAPIIFLAVSSICNIILDLVFIKCLKTGIGGAALATVISQAISSCACIIFLKKKYAFILPSLSDFKISAGFAGELLMTGLSMGMMMSLVSIGTVVMQKSVNSFGTQIVISHTAARKISHIYMMFLSTISTSSATFASQNFGAGKFRRIRTGVIRSVEIDFVWSAFAMLLTFATAPQIIHLLTGSSDKQVIETAAKYLYYNLPFYFVLSPLLVLRSTMQGIGKNVIPLISSSIELAGKFLVVLWAAPKFGYFGIIMSEPVIWIACCIFLSITFFLDPRIKKTFHSDESESEQNFL